MTKLELVKRIFKTQVKKYIPELSITFIFIILTSLTTAAMEQKLLQLKLA